MSYTLWSFGRLLGETDFAFLPAEDRQRRGSLIPTKEGEPLVEIAAGVSGALGSALTAFDIEEAAADIAAAVDRRDALELELHGPDGDVIPIERITIHDMVVLMSIADSRFEADKPWYDSLSEKERDEFDASIDCEVAGDVGGDVGGDVAHDSTFEDDLAPHSPDDEGERRMARGLPRYEISVKLADDRAIPRRT